MPKTNKRLETLMQRRAALDAQINAQKAREKASERKRETRRKVLAGAAVLFRAESDPAFRSELDKILDGFLSRPDERALFGLAERVQAA
jgi:hypothetical protein